MVDGLTSGPSVLDGVFAPGWDHARDVLVVLGRGDEELYGALQSVGQERVVEIADVGPLDLELPPPYVRVQDAFGLFHAVLGFPGPVAANAAFRRLPGVRLAPEQLEELGDALRGAVSSHAVFQGAVDLHAPRWAEQGTRNLAGLAELPSVAALDGAFRGVPCAIVSPGPSLTRNVERLAEMSERVLVMTCSHALAALEAAGITPDVVVVSDPKFMAHHFEGCRVDEVPALFLDAASATENFALPARRVFTFATHPSVDEWIFGGLGETAYVEAGGSVACAELTLAHRLGCDPILFVGQDLALSDGKYYAETSVDGGVSVEVSPDGEGFEVMRPSRDANTGEEVVVRHPTEGLLEVPAWGGGTVLTSTSLHTFLQWFRVASQALGRSATTVYNCTEGGAHVDGMRHEPLGRVLVRHLADRMDERVNAESVLDAALAGFDVTDRRRRMRASIEEMIEGLESCVREARAAGTLAVRATHDESALEELGAVEARLSAAIGPLPFVSMLAQEQIRNAQERAIDATTLDENLALAEQIFGIVREAGSALLPPLREAREALSDATAERRLA